MAGLTYKYIPLETATLIQRKHPRDIEPPGMTLLSDLYISRSDKNISLRPDLDVTSESVFALEKVRSILCPLYTEPDS